MPYAISSLGEVQTALENNRLSMGHYRNFQEDENTNANLTISCDTLAEAITCLFATASIVGACDPEHAIIDPRVQDFAREAKFALREEDGRRLDVLIGHHVSSYLRFFRQLVLNNNVRTVILVVGLQRSQRIQLSACFRMAPSEKGTQYNIHFSLFGGTPEENSRLIKEVIIEINRQFEKIGIK